MCSFKEEYLRGNELRNRWRCRKAAKAYLYAQQLAMTESQECDALHMLGVTYKMWGKLKKAEGALLEALEHAADNVRRGNILRDLADTLSLESKTIQAITAINQSLDFLKDEKVAYAASLGFRGRVLQRAGNMEQAIESFRAADESLKSINDQRLFNFLPYTNAVLQQGSTLYEPWWREAQELVDKHGAWMHRLRLRALRHFGYRADNLIQKLLPLQRFIPFI